MAPIARFVELQRGVPFKFAVETVFLDDAAYEAAVAASAPPLADAATDEWLEMLRATGLADTGVDGAALAAAAARLSVASYDSAAERLTVRGHDLTPLVRASIARELTRRARRPARRHPTGRGPGPQRLGGPAGGDPR